MNYKVKRTRAKISVYTMAKELGVDEKTYAKFEKGEMHLQNEYLEKFLDVIHRAKEININRSIKMQKVDEWIKSGQARKDLKAMGYNQTQLAKAIGCHCTGINHTLKNPKDGSNDLKEKMYDFLQNPFNKKIEEEIETYNTKIIDEVEEAGIISITPVEETKLIEIENDNCSTPTEEAVEISIDKDALIEQLKQENKKLELEIKFLKITLKRLFKI